MMQNLMLKDFIEELSSSSPAPGGGSAAALSAAVASALSTMVFNLTIGKKSYEAYSAENKKKIMDSLEITKIFNKEFLTAIDKDAEAFLDVMLAFKLPKSNEEEIKLRKEKIQLSYKKALEVPLELAKKAFSMYECIKVAIELGNKNAVSDIGVAALSLQTAIEAAVLNVRINNSAIEDKEYRNRIENQCKALVLDGARLKNEIIEIAYSKMQ